MAKNVFLIHDKIDKNFARRLAIALSLAGAYVWLDEAEIGNFYNHLYGNVELAFLDNIFLAILLSPKLLASEWFQQGIEYSLNGILAGSTATVLPLLYKDCTISTSMAGKICADFRDPANHNGMLRRLFGRLNLGRFGKESALPSGIDGIWQGGWNWSGRPRNAHMVLSASLTIPSKMIICYQKSGISTIVEQRIDVQVSGNEVTVTGTSYRFLERGISLGWNLDTFKLILDSSGKTLEGVNTDKKGIQSPVRFKRK